MGGCGWGNEDRVRGGGVVEDMGGTGMGSKGFKVDGRRY